MSGPATMHDHQRCLDLAAAAIDFQLSPGEQQDLRTHLALCDSCSITVHGMRDDAARLAAAPHPAAPVAVRNAVIGAATHRSGRGPAMRWPLVAALLALVLVGGSFVAGAVVDRLRAPVRPAPTLPAAIDRGTPDPQPTTFLGLRSGWNDLGDISDAFGGRTVVTVMPGPDGGLVGLGLERTTATPAVWVSDDGVDWTLTDQPGDVFGGSVPTSGALAGPGMLVVGRDISVNGVQRAIWSSPDGRSWARVADLGTNDEDLTMTTAPAGTIVWAPNGKVWVSTDGQTWRTGDIGRSGITDVAVDADRYIAVGQSGSDAFLVTSTDGRSWGSPQRTSATAGTQVGIERSGDDVEGVWIGDQRWQRTGSDWRSVSGATVPKVPVPASIVGGTTGLGAFGSPSSADMYRAWTWDGDGDWVAKRTDAEAGSGTPVVVAVAAHDDGWFVLTRRGSALHGWLLAP
jgi:hypothetical protein